MSTGGQPMVWNPYCGAAPDPAEIWWRWNLDPGLLIGFIVLGLILRSAGRLEPGRRKYSATAFALLLLLFVTPFCALSSALFSARVVHHVLLTTVVAPLLLLSVPASRLKVPGSLAFWTAAQALIFWAWHSPGLYAIALSSHAVYWLMQLSLLGSAIGFWSVIRRSSDPSAVAGLLASLVQTGLLGALITFAAVPLYAPHLASTWPWGLEPLEDQQLAGLIMWVPSAGIYLVAALSVAHRWLASDSRVAAP